MVLMNGEMGKLKIGCRTAYLLKLRIALMLYLTEIQQYLRDAISTILMKNQSYVIIERNK